MRMKGIDSGYKLSELLFGRGGSADAIVNVAAVELRFWAVVLGGDRDTSSTQASLLT